MASTTPPVALTVAGSDSSGGAGIQADLKTFAALEVYGASALTAVTSQNTEGVRSFVALDPAFVASQMDAVLDDLPVGAIKTGMLANAGIVEAVVRELLKANVAVIVDPVMVAKGGHALVDDAAIDTVRTRLLPRATLVTPNLPEAERLVDFPVRTLEQMEMAARALVKLGAQAALVKGGHALGDPTDVLHVDGQTVLLTAARVNTTSTHGTGCTYSAAIAAYIARGVALQDAVARAHHFVHVAIEQAPRLGRGHGPLHHMHPWYAFGASRGTPDT